MFSIPLFNYDIRCMHTHDHLYTRALTRPLALIPALPNAFMAVAVDYGDPDSPFGDIHPRYKVRVGLKDRRGWCVCGCVRMYVYGHECTFI